ncbi:MAG: DUF4349 domain-containing protein [Chlorobi bacterium]|nr:DUF4349 domain-containing protein [Chlorobiota bacterium]
MFKQSLIILGLVSIMLLSCGGGGSADELGETDVSTNEFVETSTETETSSSNNETVPVQSQRKIVYEGEIWIVDDNLDSIRQLVHAKTREYGGYIKHERYEKSDQTIHITVGVPSENFFAFMEFLKNTGEKVVEYTITTEDITDRYYDLQTRLKVKKETEKRYLELLNKAQTIDEILQVQERLEAVRRDIEHIEGRIKMYDRMVTYSTIRIKISKETPDTPGYEASYWEKVRKSIEIGIDILEYASLVFIALWPIWVAIALALLVRAIYQRYKKRQ